MLKELMYLRCLEQCLAHTQCHMNVNFINYTHDYNYNMMHMTQKQAVIQRKTM